MRNEKNRAAIHRQKTAFEGRILSAFFKPLLMNIAGTGVLYNFIFFN